MLIQKIISASDGTSCPAKANRISLYVSHDLLNAFQQFRWGALKAKALQPVG